MPENLQRSRSNTVTKTEAPISSLRDLEHATLFTLMANSLKDLLVENSTDPLSGEQDLHRILSQEALRKTPKDAEQANAILAESSALDVFGINVDTDIFYESKNDQSEHFEGMAQKPALYKENINPSKNVVNSRLRREGSGRVSSRRPFTLNSSSFGSDINVQKDLRTLEDVYEFFSAVELKETSAAIERKMRGEKSPDALSSQRSLKRRVRRQGTGRRKISKNFDWQLLGNTGKYMELDDEKLEVEEEESRSSFMSKAEQTVLIPEARYDECLSGSVNAEFQNHKDVQLDINSEKYKQAHDVHSVVNGGDIDGRQSNLVQEKETFCASENEKTVNMPPKTFFSSGNSTRNALDQLLKDYLKQGADNTNSISFSRAGNETNDIEKPYAKSFDCDTKNALLQSQTESSNTIHSQTLRADEGKTTSELHQFPEDFHLEVFNRTPGENVCQKPTKISTPSTSPTPPSKISAAFLLRRKSKSAIGVKIGDTCKPSMEKRDEGAAKIQSSSPSQHSKRLPTSLHLHTSTSLHNSSISKSSSPSHSSRRLHISSPPHISRRLNSSSPIHVSIKLSLKSPLEKKESSGVRRLSFESSSKLGNQDDKQTGIDNGENNSNAKIMDIVSPSKYSENDKGEMETTDLGISNMSRVSPEEMMPVMETEVQHLNTVVPEYTVKDILDSASGEKIEEGSVKLCKMNVEKGEMETADLDSSKISSMSPNKMIILMGNDSTELQHLNTVVPEFMEKDILGCASGERIEEAPVKLSKKNVRKSKGKRQSKNNSKSSGSAGKDRIIASEIACMKKKKMSDYQHRQSLDGAGSLWKSGAGSLWKSGVRRSTRIRSRPLEFWRGERFLYGRIHDTLTTVIGIKYSSPLNEREKRRGGPSFKVKSYVDDQYSRFVEFAASY